jgi:amidophosphoribosyltransferase
LVGRRVIMIDDSIVRGTTAGPLVKMLRDAGATEVHVRITCPPIAHPCHMGLDMGTYDELISHRVQPSELGKLIGADSLAFLSLDSLMKAIGRDDGYCNACFTGVYPVPVPVTIGRTKESFEGVLR